MRRRPLPDSASDQVRRSAGVIVEAQFNIDGSLSIRQAQWNRQAFALELAEARKAMPISEPVLEELRSGARY